jgi:hypothetical protein
MAQWPSIDQVFQDDYEHENYCHLREEVVVTHNKHTMKDTTNFHYSIGLRARNFIRLHRGILTPLRDLQDAKLGAAEQGKTCCFQWLKKQGFAEVHPQLCFLSRFGSFGVSVAPYDLIVRPNHSKLLQQGHRQY